MSKFADYVPQPLAFYKEMSAGDRQYQNYNLDHCKGDLSTWEFVVVVQQPGLTPDNPRIHIPPFSIKRSSGTGASVSSFKLLGKNGIITPVDLSTSGFSVVDLNDDGSVDAILYNGSTQTPDIAGLPYGNYEFEVKSGSGTWYSEVFSIQEESAIDSSFPASCGNTRYTRLEWSNPGCIISETIHSTALFKLLLPINIGQPEYIYKPNEADDGEGGKVQFSHRLEKRWTFFILAPEYIADALAATQMMSNVTLNFEYGDSITCRDIEVSPDWEKPCFAKIKFQFSSEVLSKTACC